ncbi:MAG: hypothetical protein ACKOBZ_05400 [Nitrospira sp.]
MKLLLKENDCDGGCEVALAVDFSNGNDRWRGTCIKAGLPRAKPGGTYTLRPMKLESAR